MGPGIPKAELPHVFETFWRYDQAHTTSGFGLGLPIIGRIAALHNGEIEVESQPGKGSVFQLLLPTGAVG